MKLDGRIGIVTGGGSGIGAATACLMAAEGARLLRVDRNAEGLAATRDAIAASGGAEAEILVADVTEAALPKKAVADLLARHGRLDTVITCAGIFPGGTVATMDEAEASPREMQARGVTVRHLSEADAAELARCSGDFTKVAEEAINARGAPGTAMMARYRELVADYAAGRLR